MLEGFDGRRDDDETKVRMKPPIISNACIRRLALLSYVAVTLEVSQDEMSPLNAEAPLNMWYVPTNLDVSHVERPLLNATAPLKQLVADVTLLTSQAMRSTLKAAALRNVLAKLVTLPVSHNEISALNVADELQCVSKSSVMSWAR